MIKYIQKSVFFLLLLTPIFSNAQQFKSGIRAGINACQIGGDRMAGFHQLGIVGGLFTAYNYNSNFDYQIEMLFSQKGSRRNFSAQNVSYGSWDVLRLDYIEVPLLLVYKLNDKIKLQGGIGIGYLFNTHWEDGYGSINQQAGFIKKIELNGTLGITYALTDHFDLFARYTNSLLPIGKDNSTMGYITYDSGLINIIASFGLYLNFLAAN